MFGAVVVVHQNAAIRLYPPLLVPSCYGLPDDFEHLHNILTHTMKQH